MVSAVAHGLEELGIWIDTIAIVEYGVTVFRDTPGKEYSSVPIGVSVWSKESVTGFA